jgi:hypothetical protein
MFNKEFSAHAYRRKFHLPNESQSMYNPTLSALCSVGACSFTVHRQTIRTHNKYNCQRVRMAKGMTTVRISTELRDKLKKLGVKGETYEDVIHRLVEIVESNIGEKS